MYKKSKIPAVPHTRPMTKDRFFRKSEYVYDEYFDCYLCPQNQILKYTTVRDTYSKKPVSRYSETGFVYKLSLLQIEGGFFFIKF